MIFLRSANGHQMIIRSLYNQMMIWKWNDQQMINNITIKLTNDYLMNIASLSYDNQMITWSYDNQQQRIFWLYSDPSSMFFRWSSDDHHTQTHDHMMNESRYSSNENKIILSCSLDDHQMIIIWAMNEHYMIIR